MASVFPVDVAGVPIALHQSFTWMWRVFPLPCISFHVHVAAHCLGHTTLFSLLGLLLLFLLLPLLFSSPSCFLPSSSSLSSPPRLPAFFLPLPRPPLPLSLLPSSTPPISLLLLPILLLLPLLILRLILLLLLSLPERARGQAPAPTTSPTFPKDRARSWPGGAILSAPSCLRVDKERCAWA